MKSNRFGCGGRGAATALVMLLAAGGGACGTASASDCEKSLLEDYTGECMTEDDAGSGGAGAQSSTGAEGGKGSTKPGGGSSSGNANAGGSASHDVYIEGFEGDVEPGDWDVDNHNPHQSEFSARAPTLGDGGSARIELDCGGVEHTLVDFVYAADARADQNLKLFIDDKLYEELPNTLYGNYVRRQIAPPPGQHTYAFEVSLLAAARPEIYLDTFVCREYDVAEATGRTDVDDGFRPPEVSGDWWADSANPHGDSSAGEAELALRPRRLEDMDSATVDVSCPFAESSHLSFVYAFDPQAQQTLEMLLDGQHYDLLPGTLYGNYKGVALALAPGQHTLTLTATAQAHALPVVWLDTITCQAETPITPTGRTDFDQPAIPSGFTGDWLIDSFFTHNDGVSDQLKPELAAHPPVLEPDQESVARLQCDEHSQISFVYSFDPQAGDELEFCVEESCEALPPTLYGNYEPHSKKVSSGSHEYSWRARVTSRKRPLAFVDTIECTD